jgi:hypothetical protein
MRAVRVRRAARSSRADWQGATAASRERGTATRESRTKRSEPTKQRKAEIA